MLSVFCASLARLNAPGAPATFLNDDTTLPPSLKASLTFRKRDCIKLENDAAKLVVPFKCFDTAHAMPSESPDYWQRSMAHHRAVLANGPGT